MTHPAVPTVFISSTVLDLADLRSAIAYDLRRMGVTVLLSEATDFPVRGDRSAIDEAIENVRSADYYLLLVGDRKGSPYDEHISVTRQESRIARENHLSDGMPNQRFFVRKTTMDAVDDLPKDTDTEDLRHQRDFAAVTCPPY